MVLADLGGQGHLAVFCAHRHEEVGSSVRQVLSSGQVSARAAGVAQGVGFILNPKGGVRWAFRVATDSLLSPGSWQGWVFSLYNGLDH